MASQILITGATGFIGRHLTQELTSAGHSVRVLARSSQKARSLFGDTVEISTGDVRDPASLKQACAGVEIVYHIAGIFRFGIRHRHEIYQTNIEGADNLLSAAANAKVQKVVHVSSASVLRQSKNSSESVSILSETDFPEKPPRFSPYKFSKWEAERRALAWARRGLPVVIANLSCPVGSGDEAPTPTGEIIRDFVQGRFPCYCRTGLNFVNVSDVCAGLQLAAQVGRTGERYLLTNQNMWLKDFLDCLAEETGLSAPGICLPHGLIQMMSCVGEMVDFLSPNSESARICIETALQARSTQFFSNAKACSELGWTPTSVQKGIQQALAWFQKELRSESTAVSLPVTKSHVR